MSDTGSSGPVLRTITQYFNNIHNSTEVGKTSTLRSALDLGSYIKQFLEVGLIFLFQRSGINTSTSQEEDVINSIVENNFIAISYQAILGTGNYENFGH